MRENISVEKAIKRGHLIVNLPVFCCLILAPVIGYLLTERGLISKDYWFLFFIIGFILAWLTWSFMITKWRIWAFTNVRNVHKLKKQAVQEKLIWREGSIFEKTEIRTRVDRNKLKHLECKFQKEDIFKEDFSLPLVTKIFYSKIDLLVKKGVSIFILILSIYLISLKTNENYLLATFLILIGLYNLIRAYRKSKNEIPIIELSNQGIKTQKTGLISWFNIYEEEIIFESFGKNSKTYLTYLTEDSFEKIQIDGLNVNASSLENMIRTYRIRYVKENPKFL
ncbi:MAG: hypothetical protein JXK08_08900 [Flavobacteriaceae bacterium]|nr:hypothetical protein [Flavobacteriaceae bacterium]